MDPSRKEKQKLLVQHKDNLQNYLNLSFKKLSKLFDPKCSLEQMVDSAKYITRKDYNDSIEERNSLSLCGYPPCYRPPKKYKYNKVKVNGVEILTEPLIPYCSINCFKSSKFYQTQLIDESIQFRSVEKLEDVEVVPLDMDVGTFWEIRRQNKGNKLDLNDKERKNYVKVLIDDDQVLNNSKLPLDLDKGIHEKVNTPFSSQQ